VVGGYRGLTGKAVMMPRWAYGFWQSRQRYETQDQLLGVVKEYRDRKLPLDNIVRTGATGRTTLGQPQVRRDALPRSQGHGRRHPRDERHFMISIWPKFYPTTEHFKELDAKGFMYTATSSRARSTGSARAI
jgi:alpha-D-xyloside xylohydrolase